MWVFAGRALRFGGEDGAGQAKAGAEEPHYAAVLHHAAISDRLGIAGGNVDLRHGEAFRGEQVSDRAADAS